MLVHGIFSSNEVSWMRKYLLLEGSIILSLLFCGIELSAQTDTSSAYLVFGKIINDQTNIPSANQSINLFKGVDMIFIKETVTDSVGNFRFYLNKNEIDTGTFFLVSSQFNEEYVYKKFVVKKGQYSYNLKNVVAKNNSILLEGVEVISSTPLFERKIDKLIVNIENSPLAAGTAIMELLPRFPGVRVDQSGNISINGKDGVMLLIDGKGQYTRKEQVISILSSLSSESIKEIEIISNPSAKYDANQGSVINIITKKDYAKSEIHANYKSGLFPVEDNSALSFPTLGGGANINYKLGKFKTSFSIDFSDIDEYRSKAKENIHFDNLNAYRKGRYKSEYTEKKLVSRIGLTYELSNLSNLNFDFFLFNNFDKTYFNNDQLTFFSNSLNDPDSSIRSNGTLEGDKFHINSFTLTYGYKFDTTDTKHIDVFFDHTKYSSPLKIRSNIYHYNNSQDLKEDDYNFLSDREYNISINSLKIDYSQSAFINEKNMLYAGLKFTDIETSEVTGYLKEYSSGESVNIMGQEFLYDESIIGAYLMFKKKIGKIESQIGVRSEMTLSTAYAKDFGNDLSDNYLNFFPSLSFLYSIDKNNKLGIEYNKRIVRVSFSDLNPYSNYNSPFVISKGNLSLSPQFINYWELSYLLKQLYFSISFSSQKSPRTDIPIQTDNPALLTRRFENLDRVNNLQFNLNHPYAFNSWWSTYNSISVENHSAKLRQHNWISLWNYRLSTNQTFIISPISKLELSAFYNSKYRYSYTEFGSIYAASVGYKGSFLKGRVDLSVSVTDVFGTNRYSNISLYDTQSIEFNSLMNNRSFNISIKYNFNTGVAFTRNKGVSKGDFGEKRY